MTDVRKENREVATGGEQLSSATEVSAVNIDRYIQQPLACRIGEWALAEYADQLAGYWRMSYN